MPVTTGWPIWFPDDTMQIAPFEGLFTQLATSTSIAMNALQLAVNQGNVPLVNDLAAQSAMFPSPVQGNRAARRDLGYTNVYREALSPTNPGGATPAGWYPEVAGAIVGVMKRTTAAMVAPNGSYANLSANTLWGSNGPQAQLSPGIAYNAGFIPSVAGMYRLTSVLSANGRWSAGFTINTPTVTDFQALLAPNVAPSDILIGASSQVVYVPAGATVRFFAAGLAASIAFSADVAKSVSIQMEYVGPPRTA